MKGGWRLKVKGFLTRLDENYDADELSDSRGGSRWNRLLDRIAVEIEQVMQAELLQPPGEPAYIPLEYLIFLSPNDERELRGDRRVGFLRGLRNATAEAAKRLVGGRAQTEKVFVQIRSDGSLSPDQFCVKALWEVEHDSTQVASPRLRGPGGVRRAADDEETQVPSRYRPSGGSSPWVIVVDQGEGSASKEHPLLAPQLTIGRGGKQIRVDLPLLDDLEISRHHLSVHVVAGDSVWIEVVGRNPVRIGDLEIASGENQPWLDGEMLRIGKYRLKLKYLRNLPPETITPIES